MHKLENALSETSTLSLDCVFVCVCVWLVNGRSGPHMTAKRAARVIAVGLSVCVCVKM